MSKSKTKKKGRVMWGFIYVVVFLTAFLASVVMKMTADPFHGKYTVKWDESVGKVYTDGKMTKETLVCKLGKMRKEYLVCDIKDATWNLLIDYPRTGTMTVQVNDHEVIKCLRKDNRYHQI